MGAAGDVAAGSSSTSTDGAARQRLTAVYRAAIGWMRTVNDGVRTQRCLEMMPFREGSPARRGENTASAHGPWRPGARSTSLVKYLIRLTVYSHDTLFQCIILLKRMHIMNHVEYGRTNVHHANDRVAAPRQPSLHVRALAPPGNTALHMYYRGGQAGPRAD